MEFVSTRRFKLNVGLLGLVPESVSLFGLGLYFMSHYVDLLLLGITFSARGFFIVVIGLDLSFMTLVMM